MRISRPCYDKPHRCPGWAGGGWLYPKIDRCRGGSMPWIYDKRAWRWRFNRHPECGVIVLPRIVSWLDWRHWHLNVVFLFRQSTLVLVLEVFFWRTVMRIRKHDRGE